LASMTGRRLAAVACLGCITLAVIASAVTVVRAFPRGLVTVGILVPSSRLGKVYGAAVVADWRYWSQRPD
jgi:hypothetical protein